MSVFGQLQAVDWRQRLLGNYLQKWVVLGALIGIIAGLGAILFFVAIELSTDLLLGELAGLHPPLPAGEGDTVVEEISRRWMIPVVLVIGGLLSGIIVFTLAPEAEGHGTDAAIEAFHERGGYIRPLIPPVKIIASAITIGSGGSAGREGPTAQIAAGFGSLLGDVFRLTAEDRRIAVAVGIGAGVGAIFKAPLGGAILAAEILYIRDFEVGALIPGFIASVIGYSIFAGYEGWDPVFADVSDLEFREAGSLIWYAVLGVAAGLVGILYARGFYATRDFFKRITIPPHVKPAIGALAVGLMGMAVPEVLSSGYGWMQFAIEGNTAELAIWTMLLLVGLKIVATSLTIGSGGSGGVFAPGLFIGAMLGGTIWWLLDGQVAYLPDTPAPFVIVGMMALFGGVAKAPIAVMIMVAEMTGEFSMIVPAMIATSLAYLVTGNITIYENQVENRAASPAHRAEFTIPLVQQITVGDAMRRAVITSTPNETLRAAEERMMENNVRSLPVVDDGKLVGMFAGTDLLRGLAAGVEHVGEAMATDVIVAYPADSLHTALQRMARAGISRLPVVERERPDRIIGVVSMRDVGSVLDLELSSLAARPRRQGAITEDPLRSVLVREAMRTKSEAVAPDQTIKRVANRLSSVGAHFALLVDDDGELQGIVTVGDLANAADEDTDRAVSEIATKRVITARPDMTVSEALALPGAEDLRQVVVTETLDGKNVPIGVINRNDVVAAYLRSRDRQAQIARRARDITRENPDSVERLDLHIHANDPAAGKTLAELGLPPDSVVTAVFRENKLLVPRGQLQLEPGDHVEILASAEARLKLIEVLQASIRSSPDGGESDGA
jgi:CIC family chloride channel protein